MYRSERSKHKKIINTKLTLHTQHLVWRSFCLFVYFISSLVVILSDNNETSIPMTVN